MNGRRKLSMEYDPILKCFSIGQFGFSLKNKLEINREKELLIKYYLLNKFTDIGMPKFEMAV